MNRIYRFHPGEYELGANEKFYGDMEARGWRLVRRGRYLSGFVRCAPSEARYRVEVYMPEFLEEPGMGEAQLAVFEDCGWEYIGSRRFLHIFRAPEGSSAPEFYADPRQQAATLQKVRRDLLWGWLGFSVTFLLFFASFGVGVGKPFPQWNWAQARRLVEIPGYVGFLTLLLLFFLYRLVWDTWQVNRTYLRLKRGLPLEHAPKGRRLIPKIAGRGLACLMAVCVVATAVQLLAVRTTELPLTPDGPYLLLSDLGLEGERSELWYGKRESSVTRSASLLTDYWDVFEIVEDPAGQQFWMYQDVYRLRVPGLTGALARSLRETSVFAPSGADYDAVSIPGLDAAWVYGDLEAVAVKGDMAAHVECLGLDAQTALEALAERWRAE